MPATWTGVPAPPAGPGCEIDVGGVLAEPVSAWTSLAFVVAGAVIVLLGVRGTRGTRGALASAPAGGRRRLLGYAALVAGVGVGSFMQHGPDPAWSDPAHDLPLVATLLLVGAAGVADLAGRDRAWWWWATPTLALIPVIVVAPRVGDLAQVGAAVVVVSVTVVRAVARPSLRRRIGWALALLAVGATIGTLSRAGGPLCDPTSLLQGHAVWHLLAAAALVVLAPTVAGTGPTAPVPTASVSTVPVD